LEQKAFKKRIDPVRGDLVVGKLRARIRKIRAPGRQTRIVIRIIDRSGRVINFDAAHAEISCDFSLCWYGQNLGVCLRQAQTLIIDKEKGLLPDERAAKR